MNPVLAWVPPALRHAANRALGANISYRGPYPTWEDAVASTRGYSEASILDRVAFATRQVLDGRATYEQDGTAFNGGAPAQHAASGLLLASSLDHGRLSVLDFGGGLGSHYLRWRQMLSPLPDVHWSIVEQEQFVDAGRRLFQDDIRISFHRSIAETSAQPNAILASSALQYLRNPHDVIRDLVSLKCRIIVIDRMPYGVDDEERICAQSVPAQLGRASYPLWMLSRSAVHAQLTPHYSLVHEFESSDRPMRAGRYVAKYQGSVWALSS